MITAEFDPLRDEGESYAAALVEAGGAAELRRYAGMVHGFMRMAGVVDDATAALAESAAFLRSAFDG